ncbi:phosphoenolpyruvate--protein phosphotransferase [Akkermansiaceae bacterium]|nr:phosphoenolpyruvate--protein phosphotransferase [Akkermansiaceae bacterium]
MLPSRNQSEIIFQGIGVSPGIAIGPTHVISHGHIIPDAYDIAKDEVKSEQARYLNAVKVTLEQLASLKEKLEDITSSSEAAIFEAHQLIIQDKSLTKKVNDGIESTGQNAEAVFYKVVHKFTESLRTVNDPYLSERAADLDDICERVLMNFRDADHTDQGPKHKHIIIANDLAPSTTAVMDRNHVLGMATEEGSVTSHTAILARSLGIPAIVGVRELVPESVSMSECIVDGETGKLILYPTEETTAYYLQKQREQLVVENRESKSSRQQKITQTKDGHVIILSANIEFSHELDQVAISGAEGVGLFRTEFFLLNDGDLPTEEEQFQEYKIVAIGTGEHMAVIRTLDAGGDKLPLEVLSKPEPNPFLGWRGLRVSLSRVEIFKDQLRAILRASAFGKLGVMFPMVSGISEIIDAKRIFEECKLELKQKGIAYGDDVQMGAMIEVPSAALLADKLAKYVDFFSIGTNDLVQYTVAVDRVNPQVSHLYRPCNPGVIRLIKMTVDAAKKHSIWTGVCGEMAAMLDVLPLLIGLGIDELSVGSSQLPRIKKAISMLDHKKCQELAKLALDCECSNEIRNLSKALALECYPEYLTPFEADLIKA